LSGIERGDELTKLTN